MMAAAFGKAPEKDAVYKLVSKSYTLNTDGSTEFRKRTELQIFTRMTFDHFGETFITYNPDFQSSSSTRPTPSAGTAARWRRPRMPSTRCCRRDARSASGSTASARWW